MGADQGKTRWWIPWMKTLRTRWKDRQHKRSGKRRNRDIVVFQNKISSMTIFKFIKTPVRRIIVQLRAHTNPQHLIDEHTAENI